MCLHCDCLTRGLLFQFQLALTVAWATPVTPMDMVTIVSTVSPGFFKSIPCYRFMLKSMLIWVDFLVAASCSSVA